LRILPEVSSLQMYISGSIKQKNKVQILNFDKLPVKKKILSRRLESKLLRILNCWLKPTTSFVKSTLFKVLIGVIRVMFSGSYSEVADKLC